MLSDGELLRRYAESGSEEAFTALVQRHIHVVYHTALRRVGGNAHCADDVTQKVFTDLARKARSLADRPSIAGWLYTGVRYAAADAVRAERRRRVHEQEAQTMNELNGPAPIAAERIDPFLDEVMDLLSERDREAVLLHYFEGRTFVEIGAILSLTADGARMRVNRALDRLRGALAQRGIASSAAALGAVLLGQSALAAPASLVTSIATQAIAQASAPALGMSPIERGLDALRSALSTSSWGGAVALGLIAVALYSLNPPGDATPLRLPLEESRGALASPASAAVAEPVASPGTSDAAANEPAVQPAENTHGIATGFGALSIPEKNILKNLWTRENAVTRPRGMRPGLNVQPSSPRFEQFEIGRQRLLSRGWVGIGEQHGLTHLTDAGRVYCATHHAEIEAYPQYYGAPTDN